MVESQQVKEQEEHQDIKIIKRYHGWISWADETEIVPTHISSPGSPKFAMMAENAIYYPVHWQDFETRTWDCGIWEFSRKYELRPIFIIWGDPSDEVVEKVWWDSMKVTCFFNGDETPLICVFVDVGAVLQSSRIVARALDGVDLVKTLKAIVKDGKNANPVWEWESK